MFKWDNSKQDNNITYHPPVPELPKVIDLELDALFRGGEYLRVIITRVNQEKKPRSLF